MTTRRSLAVALVAMLAAGAVLFAAMPPAPKRVAVAGWQDLAARTVAGAYHVHTTRSDGHGDKRAVAAAAARAGLGFVILTDHGDGTRPPDPPEYIDGVLMLDGVEISTDDGHYVALDMPRAPYPLGGAAAAVVEDVHRLGGFGIAAHPDSPKPALRWTDAAAAVDGLEWINADSEWRDETRRRLVRAGLAYFLRPAPALALVLDRPPSLERWQTLLRERFVVALGGADAHGGPGQRVEDAGRTLSNRIGIPSYEASFREMTTRVVLDRAPTGEGAGDARAVFAAIRQGRVFTLIDALASPGLLDFRAVPSAAGATMVARAPLPRGAEIVLLGPEGEVGRAPGELRHDVPAGDRGAYRVEIRVPGAPGTPPVPWLVSNPVYVTPPSAPFVPPAAAAPGEPSAIAPFPWRVEKDAASSSILRTSQNAVELEYKLADGARGNQFVALATDLHRQSFRGVDLSLAADRPMRIGVQVRTADGRRWGASFYVDPAGTLVRARLSELRGVDDRTAPAPDGGGVSSLLLVVDLTNAAPGRSGRFVVRSSGLVN